MLASDAIESKLRFPCFVQPKIDGVRGMTTSGNGLTGRSLKPHANKYTTEFYSKPEYRWFDGELAAERQTADDLCRLTTSALSTIEGQPYTLWHVFDFLYPGVAELPYLERYDHLDKAVTELQAKGLALNLRLIPNYWAHDLETVLEWDAKFLDLGYEGTIIRDPYGMHKQGRSTVREMGLLRIKRFIEEDVQVISIIEGESNQNEAQTNELGLQFRTSHQDNMIPNGMVGAMMCLVLKDIKDLSGKLLFAKGEIIKVGAGKLTHEQRLAYFKNPDLLVGAIIKFKFFPKGVMDKPRFPTYQSMRAISDISC